MPLSPTELVTAKKLTPLIIILMLTIILVILYFYDYYKSISLKILIGIFFLNTITLLFFYIFPRNWSVNIVLIGFSLLIIGLLLVIIALMRDILWMNIAPVVITVFIYFARDIVMIPIKLWMHAKKIIFLQPDILMHQLYYALIIFIILFLTSIFLAAKIDYSKLDDNSKNFLMVIVVILIGFYILAEIIKEIINIEIKTLSSIPPP